LVAGALFIVDWFLVVENLSMYSYPKFQALDIRETQEQVITGIRLVDD
jgi:hypothetical protein